MPSPKKKEVKSIALMVYAYPEQVESTIAVLKVVATGLITGFRREDAPVFGVEGPRVLRPAMATVFDAIMAQAEELPLLDEPAHIRDRFILEGIAGVEVASRAVYKAAQKDWERNHAA